TRPTIPALRPVSASAAPGTARSRPSFRHPMPRLRRPKESALTMRATSMAAGPARWRCGAGPGTDLSVNPACNHPLRSERVIVFTSPRQRKGGGSGHMGNYSGEIGNTFGAKGFANSALLPDDQEAAVGLK